MNTPAFIFGSIFGAFGVFACYDYFKKRKYCTAPINGTVIRIDVSSHRSEGGGVSHNYIPVVSYSVNCKKDKRPCLAVNKPNKYAIGDQIPLRYNPDNPEHCYALYEKTGAAIAGPLCLLIGGGLIIASFYI